MYLSYQLVMSLLHIPSLFPDFFSLTCILHRGFPSGSVGKKKFACSAGDCLQCKRHGFHPWVGKIPWRRKWQATPVFLTEESHGQRRWVGYSPWGHKELDKTERLSTDTLEIRTIRWKLLTHWKDVTVPNLYASNNRASKVWTTRGSKFIFKKKI